MSNQRPDLNLALKRYIDGDDGAFDVIIDEMRRPLIFFINGYVNNIYTAEDICMDTFAALLLNLDRYSFKCALSTYLFTLARNKAVDYVRHNSVLQITELADFSRDPDYRSIEEEYIKDEEKRELRRELARLPEKYHTVLYLHYFENMEIGEIASVMKKNKKQVYNLMFRAKEELRRRLTKG